ncbi:MAG TPA: glycerol-3-phosphate dehydrogenase/oxidase, partial [Gemmatimonadaceae bacterium]|nr:glycerol-3-phosphate dehydrogenase/oxidase [Gemmatimonadaceae bacterium]
MPSSPSLARRRALERLASERYDLLVVGGGITGAGIARDAALRGLRTALVERADFGGGTSSRSSRLVHGGVRYLEHGQIGLVFEASRERARLLRLAPHVVRPLAFTWPVYRGARVPRWKLGVGLWLYDALARFRNVGRHERLTAADVLRAEPRLRPDGLVGGARYWDAATDDARLTLLTALGALEAGATVVNHAEVAELLRRDGRTRGAVVRDRITGEERPVSATIVVNATGPWTDALLRLDGASVSSLVRGTKGVHVLVPRERVGNVAAVTLVSAVDGRVMFVLPAGPFALIGTTDTPTVMPPDQVRATAADVEYLLASANATFPDARLTGEDVISA